MILHSNIHTGGQLAHYIVIDGNTVLYIGNERPDKCNVTEMTQYHIYPGFIDSHMHLMQYGLSLYRCDLRQARSADDIMDSLKSFINTNSDLTFIIAEGYDDSQFIDNSVLEKTLLDNTFSGLPVIVRRICGHKAIINQDAYEIISQNDHFSDSLYDESTGVIEEGAVLHLNSIFRPTDREKVNALNAASLKLFELGITSLGDMSTVDSMKYYREHMLKHDIIPYLPSDSLSLLDNNMDIAQLVKGIKVFVDGSIGARTAAMRRPYRDTDRKGDLCIDNEYMKRVLNYADKYGLQIAAHAIGDRAIDFIVKYLRKSDRIEHCEFADRDVLESIRNKGIYLSMQPNFIGNWGVSGKMYEKVLDYDYYSFNNSYAYIDNMNITLGMGSDNMPPSPLYGIQSAANAEFENQRLTAERCMELYTKGSSDIMDIKKGILNIHSAADFTVLSRSISEKPDVLLTVKNGEIVYKRGQL